MNNEIKKNNKGFGLLEVIVSISVVVIGILPLVNLFNSVLRAERDTENKLKAIYFAQEGIEIVRQIRDTNWTKYPAKAWSYEPISDGSIFGIWGLTMGNCAQFENFELEAADSDNIKIKYQSGKPYKQGCSGGSDTGFTRTILIEDIDYNTGVASLNADYMKITSIIRLDGAVLYSLTSYLNRWN